MRRKYLVLLLILLLLFGLSGCKSEEEKQAEQAKQNWTQTTDEGKMSIYCALIKEYMLLQEDLGENTPYPAMKRSVKGAILSGGLTQEEALDHAEKVLLEERAVFWRGMEDGIDVSDKKVTQYIEENVLQELKASDSYALVDEVCQKEGITFEDTIWAYEDSYKMEYIAKAAGADDTETFAAFKEGAVEAYKTSAEYDEFQYVMTQCRKLIEEAVTDKETLRQADIYW